MHDRRCGCKGTGRLAVSDGQGGGEWVTCDHPQDYNRLCDECGSVYVEYERWSDDEWNDPEVIKLCDRCTLENFLHRRKW